MGVALQAAHPLPCETGWPGRKLSFIVNSENCLDCVELWSHYTTLGYNHKGGGGVQVDWGVGKVVGIYRKDFIFVY